ncbi:hypothetical protein GPK89_09470 [Gemmiger formicilis]|nr:hypothetical protein [Gemmiger formicilis]
MRKCRIGTAKFFTLLLLLYHTSINIHIINHNMVTRRRNHMPGRTVYSSKAF